MSYVPAFNPFVSVLRQAITGLQGSQTVNQSTAALRSQLDSFRTDVMLTESIAVLEPVLTRIAQDEETPELRQSVFEAIQSSTAHLSQLNYVLENNFDFAKFHALCSLIAKGVSSLHSEEPPTKRPPRRRSSSSSTMIKVDPDQIPADLASTAVSAAPTAESDQIILSARVFINSLGVPAGFFEIGLDGSVILLMCNEANERISGFTEAELKRRDFMKNIHTDHVRRFGEVLNDVFKPDGLYLNDVPLLKSDETYVHVDLRARMVEGRKGLYFCIDRTERKKAAANLRQSHDELEERIKTEEKEREGELLKLIGNAAAGIAHDLQNSLFMLLGVLKRPQHILGLLEAELTAASDDDLETLLDNVIARFAQAWKDMIDLPEEATQNDKLLAIVQLLIAQLKEPQRIAEESSAKVQAFRGMQSGTGELYPFHIHELLSETVGELLPDELAKSSIQMESPATLIMSDAERFRPALRALIQNAADAMRDRAENHFTAEVDTIEFNSFGISRLPRHSLNKLNIKPGKFVRIRLTDTGHGIEEDQLLKIFQIGVSSHNSVTLEENRRGLGLPLVQIVMMESLGFVTVESTPDVGSTFTLYFPAVGQES